MLTIQQLKKTKNKQQNSKWKLISVRLFGILNANYTSIVHGEMMETQFQHHCKTVKFIVSLSALFISLSNCKRNPNIEFNKHLNCEFPLCKITNGCGCCCFAIPLVLSFIHSNLVCVCVFICALRAHSIFGFIFSSFAFRITFRPG